MSAPEQGYGAKVGGLEETLSRGSEGRRLIRVFDYDKVGPVAKAFAKSNTRRRFIRGPVGSAKSSTCAVEVGRRACAQAVLADGLRRTKWAIIRNTYRQLEDTTLETFLHWFPNGAFGNYKAGDATYFMKIGDVRAEFLFRAMDRPDQIGNLLSLELTGAWPNEFREIPWPIIEAVDQRIPRYPSIDDGGPTWFGLVADTNPYDEDSDAYRVLEIEKPKGYELFVQPPAMLYDAEPGGRIVLKGVNPEAENLANLMGTQDYGDGKGPIRGGDIYYPDMAQGKSDSFIRVFILNQCAFAMDGMPVYPEYKDHLHASEKYTYIKGFPIYRGWDFGGTPACLFIQRTPKGAYRVIHEMHTTIDQPMGIERFAKLVQQESAIKFPETKEFLDYADPAGKQRAQTDEKTCFDIMRAAGIYAKAAENQTEELRKGSMRHLLNTLADGEPAFQVNAELKFYRRALMSGYHYRRLRTSFDRYEDKPDKNEYSHIVEAGEYGFAGLIGRQLRGFGAGSGVPIAANKRKRGLLPI